MAWVAGQQLQDGKYTIEKELGEGGFGITYLAKDNNGNFVVIKTLNDAIQKRADFAKFQQDFLNEAIKLAKCSHSHIVQIYEVIHENDLWCMVMEYIEGEDLGSFVENQGVLSETEALRYIQQIGSTLTLVHNNGLLHRDIMLRAGKSEAVLIDFGIAREFTPNLTKTHTKILSDGFAPIEQYDARAKRGAFTDVYALAATLYSLLTGELPTISPMRAIGTELEEAKKINSSISDRVNEAITKGMEIKPENRPQSINEWLSLLNIQKTSNNTILSATQIIEDKIIREFKTHVDYKSSKAGLLIHHKESSSDHGEEPDSRLIKLALSHVAEALAEQNLTPEQAKLHREQLDQILSQPGNEAIYNLANWLNALGLKLTVTMIEHKDKSIINTANNVKITV